MPIDELREDAMMSHLLATLESGKTIEHYGRLVFAMVARHFMEEEEVVEWLSKDPEAEQDDPRRLVSQVSAKDYNPPQRERILEWMGKQNFEICPQSEDPKQCNVYRSLTFPETVYNKISAYYEKQSGV